MVRMENLWVDFTDSVIPAHAGIQMFRTFVDRLSFSEKHFLSDQVRIQIPPAWVQRFNRLYLPRPLPVLDGFFPLNGGFHRPMPLIPDSSMHTVSTGKAFNEIILMFPNPLYQLRSYTCIYGSISFAG